MKKKLIALVMSVACCFTAVVAGCKKPEENNNSTQYSEYSLYLTYAAQQNITPLSYEEWLASIKGEKGDTGAKGENGADGKGIVKMEINAQGNLIVYYTDAPETAVDLGKVKGESTSGGTGTQGPAGPVGPAGRGVELMTINSEGHLIVYYTDAPSVPVDLGKVVGEDGAAGSGGSGSSGPQWFNGTTSPLNAQGSNGDYYIDTDDFVLYLKKSGEWTVLLQKFGGKDNTKYYKNLFNMNDADNTKGGMVKDSDGSIQSTTASLMATHYIPVEAGKAYLYNVLTKMASNIGSGYVNIFFYDANKEYLGKDTGGKKQASIFDNNGTTENTNAHKEDDILRIVAPAEAFYTRFTISTDYIGGFMFVEDCGITDKEWPYQFVEYGTKLAIPGTEDTSGGGLTDAEKQLLAQSNPLYMKKVGWEGDSLMEGKACAGGFAKMIAEANGMNSTNSGVSGGTITSGVSGVSHYIVDGVITMTQANYNYIIVDGGVNDCSRSVALGDESAYEADNYSNEYIADLDKTTFRGAFELMCAKLALSGKKVGYIFAHKIDDTSMGNWSAYRTIMLELLQKWGVPYLDLETKIPPLGMNATLSATYAPDKWHPNEAGYKTYYVDQITAWMKTL